MVHRTTSLLPIPPQARGGWVPCGVQSSAGFTHHEYQCRSCACAPLPARQGVLNRQPLPIWCLHPGLLLARTTWSVMFWNHFAFYSLFLQQMPEQGHKSRSWILLCWLCSRFFKETSKNLPVKHELGLPNCDSQSLPSFTLEELLLVTLYPILHGERTMEFQPNWIILNHLSSIFFVSSLCLSKF